MDTQGAIRKRRSIRAYQTIPVEPEKVEAVLEAARWAPSGVNAQPWSFVVVRDPGVRQALSQVVLGSHRDVFSRVTKDPVSGPQLDERMKAVYSALPSAPVYIVVCLEQKREYFQAGYEREGYEIDLVSVAAAMENLLLVAADLGLGTCWMAAPTFREQEMKGLLGIPAGVKVVALTPLGYPAENPEPRPRDPLPDIVHYDRWQPKKVPAPAPGYDKLLTVTTPSPALPAEELVARGHQAFSSGRVEEAIAAFTSALQQDPRYALAYRNRGSALYARGDYSGAEVDYTRALELEPSSGEVYYYRGLARRSSGRIAEALQDFDQALKLGFRDARVYYSRAVAYAATGKGDLARADLQALLTATTDQQLLQAAHRLQDSLRAQGTSLPG